MAQLPRHRAVPVPRPELGDRDGRVRLHRRRGRHRRQRRRQPAHREPGRQGPGPRGGRARVPPNVDDASIWYTLLGSPVDWGYTSVPQPGLDGRQTYEPRGKAPGGSSNLYIMMHIRGHPSDYDNWAYNGAAGWSYEDCLPYFQKLEDQEDDTSPSAGHGGPLPVTNAGQARPEPDLAGLHRRMPRAGLPARPTISTARTWKAPAGTTSTWSTASGSRPTGPTSSRRSTART